MKFTRSASTEVAPNTRLSPASCLLHFHDAISCYRPIIAKSTSHLQGTIKRQNGSCGQRFILIRPRREPQAINQSDPVARRLDGRDVTVARSCIREPFQSPFCDPEVTTEPLDDVPLATELLNTEPLDTGPLDTGPLDFDPGDDLGNTWTYIDAIHRKSSQGSTAYRLHRLADLHSQDAVYHPKDRCLCNRSFHAGFGRPGHLVVALCRLPTCGILMRYQYSALGHDVSHSLNRYVMTCRCCVIVVAVCKMHSFPRTVDKHLGFFC